MPSHPRTTPDPGPPDAWARFGWLMGAIWLVFMVFPVSAVFFVDDPLRRVTGLVILAVFAGVYLHGLWVDDRPAQALVSDLRWYVAALVVLAIAMVPFIGYGALGLVPFVLSLAAIVLGPRQSLAVLGVAMLLLLVVTVVGGQVADWWFFFLIYPMVTLTLVLVGTLDASASRQRESRRQLGIAEERERVARDVHDVLGHSLTVIAVKSELAERLVEVDPVRARAEIAELGSISRQALAEVRATVAGLRVARLGDEIEAARVALDGAGIECVVVGDPAEVDPRHRIVLAWALREAVTNVVRHSGATRCEIRLARSALVVRDDGKGVRGSRQGNGISGLRERAEQAGGSLEVAPADPGTRLEVRV